MAIVSAADLLGLLRQLGLLQPAQLDELTRKLAGKQLDPRAIGKKLIDHGWLTPYQVNQLLQGRGQDLVLGPYLVLERLGEGGNGQVLKARHQALQREVAIKVLHRELLTDAEVVGRFHREIEVVSHISHPNIVHAFDAGPIGADLVLAMEFIDGIDLNRLVREVGPLAVAAAVDFIRQAAIGLQHAHERGLVHRDIKPANLLVTQLKTGKSAAASEWSTLKLSLTHNTPSTSSILSHGLIKILDLGLARLQEPPRESPTANLTLLAGQSVTQGTPDYMAPEQALDFHAADIRSDIYSLGCTFYFLLTGQPPFSGRSLAEKLMKHQQAEPTAVQSMRSDIPGALVPILAKMLAKRPEERFQTPGEVAAAVTKLLADGTMPTVKMEAQKKPARSFKPARWLVGAFSVFRRRPWLALTALGLLLVASSLLFVLFVWQKPADIGESSDQAALKRALELLDDPESDERLVVHRLGRFLRMYPHLLGPLREELFAVRLRLPGSPQAMQAAVWLTYLSSPLDQLDKQQIPEKKRFAGQPAELVAILGDPSDIYHRVSALAFRPDGKMLAVAIATREIGLWEFGQSTPRQLPTLRGHGSYIVSLAFTLDNKWLASGGGDNYATGDNNIRLWAVTQPEIKAEVVLSGHTSTVNALAVSPDGKWLASSGEDQSVRLWELPQREGRVLAPKTTFVKSLAFAPDNKTLAVAGSYWPLIRLQELTPSLADKHVDLKYAASQYTLKVAFTPDGQTLAATTGNQVVLWDPVKRVERGRLQGQSTMWDLVFLPDGKTLLAGEAGEEIQGKVNEPEGRVIGWSMQSREPSATWRLPCGGVKKLALASDGRHLAVGGRNSVVYILRLGPPKIVP